jgi:outer membrane protein assembly factor BamB
LAGLKNPEFKSSSSSTGSKGGWPCFLGPNQDNVSQETGLLPRWPPQGPTLAWHTPGLGQGFSTVSISDGTVFTMGTPEGQESLLAIGLDGKALWSVPTGGSIFQEASGNGPRSTPTVDGGHVYATRTICSATRSAAISDRVHGYPRRVPSTFTPLPMSRLCA